MLDLKEYAQVTKLIVTAHRAGAGNFTDKENSKESILAALDLGIEVIEIDLVATNDGAIAYHDEQIEIDGNSLDVANLSSDFVKVSNSNVISFEEVLDLVCGKAYLVLEMKLSCFSQIQNIVSEVIKRGMLRQTVFVSFYTHILNEIKLQSSDSVIGFIANPSNMILPSVAMQEVDYDLYVCSIADMNESIAKDAFEIKLATACYDVNDEETLKKAEKFRVKAIGTDYPQLILPLISQTK